VTSRSIRLSLDVSVELNAKLQELAAKTGRTKSDVLRCAIALMDIAVQASEAGKRIGIAKEGDELATEIVGL
jgi:predicted transcriptional regulator